MAKVKNKRNAGLADKVHNKRKTEANKKKLNPFEVHINREKLKVIGQKSKHDRGLPGVSRAKAIKKRKETLGTEMKLMNKTNTFIDRRIGEKNNTMSSEDRIIARFAAERAKQHSKKNIYNLADDEILTHRGQTLEQIEKFDDPKSSDDEDENVKTFGGLDDDFVSEAHFGGGVLSRGETDDGAKSHKDLIEQLIAESKKRKAEKQKEKEQTLDLTEKLDSEWKDLQPVVLKKARVEEKEESLIDKLLNDAEKRNQDYDRMMRELRYEKRGTPSDGLKSTEQQEREERHKLELLEMERQKRMMGDLEVSTPRVAASSKHRSADDLDDNFDLEDEKDFMLAYDKDGNPLVPEEVLKANSVPNSKQKFDDGISDTSSDDDGDDENSDDEDEKSDNDEENDNNDNEQEESSDTENDEKESVDTVKVKDKAQVKVSVEEPKSKTKVKTDNAKDISNENEIVNSVKEKVKVQQKNTDVVESKRNGDVKTKVKTVKEEEKTILFAKHSKNDDSNDSEDESESEDDEGSDEVSPNKENEFDNVNELKESDKESDVESETDVAADNDRINSFFSMKSAVGDNLKELLEGKTPTQQSIAIQKLIKSYDPSLAENNKDLLSRLFAHLLQYVNDIFSNLKEEGDVLKAFLIFDKIAPHLYDLAQTNKVSSKKYIAEVLKEKHDKFKKNPRIIPDLDTLIFFKLVSLIYPTSDFKHPITTPCFVFMSDLLTLCRFNNIRAITRGLFVMTLILEYTVLSKRFLPSGINFLRGLLFLTANTSILNPIQVVPPFRLHKDEKILQLEEDCSKMAVGHKMAAKDLVLNDVDNDFKIRCLSTCNDMLRECFDNLNDLEAQECIFQPHIQLLSKIDLDWYPKSIREKVSENIKYMTQCLEVKTYTQMTVERKRPKALRLYEPDVQDVFTGSKSGKLSKEKAESNKLQHKYKKEMKGALREIRRDKSFIASVKIRQKIQSDNVRREKVKQIYKDASIQQGELNKLKRMK